MISHKYKTIFIHIPRTAGTSIEKWIYGNDWWQVEGSTKHLLASQAKELYKDYWDDYFKFSFVRNPFDRMVSCLALNQFKVKLKNGLIDLSEYREIHEKNSIILEYDYRFYNRKNVESDKHKPHQIYKNTLDEEIDFIGKFETLEKDTEYIRDILEIENKFEGINHTIPKSNRKMDHKLYYNKYNKTEIANIFYNDFKQWYNGKQY